MKNTRKKMLLSSIAMLLVALIALGSATFAWFTSSPDADAKGLTMKTTAGTGLLALSQTHNTAKSGDWSHHTILNASTTLSNNSVVPATNSIDLQPASLTNSNDSGASTRSSMGDFYNADADKDDNYALPASFSADGVTPGLTGGGVYKETVNLKVTGGADNATAYLAGITWQDGTASYALQHSVRVAITDTEDKLIAVYANGAYSNKYLEDATTLSSSDYTTTAKGTFASGSRPSIGSVGKSGNSYINVYVYVDGEDSSCYTLGCSGADVLKNFELYLTLTP